MFKTPVSVLQELTVQKGFAAPAYEVRGSGVPHCMTFTCQVKIGDKTAEGKGSTKKDAKHDAAKNMLNVFGMNLDNQTQMTCCLLPSKPSKSGGPSINYVGKLNEFCSGHRHPQPSYIESTTLQNAAFCITCIFNNYKIQGSGFTKKDAKQDSAKNMLALLKEKFPEDDIPIVPVPTDSTDTLDDKYILNDDLSKQVLSKYTEMMNNISINGNKNENNMETVNREANVSTWDELLELLDKHGYNYELTTFQRYPLILSLKINELVLMNSGATKEAICQKLMVDAIRMIREGVDFSKPLLA